jgi:tRNA pseudouridine13 synthase
MLVSALQSELFNRTLASRIREGVMDRPLDGDLLQRHDRPGLMDVDHLEQAAQEVEAWRASPTGPMFGPRMRWPGGEAGRREHALLAEAGLSPEDLRRLGRLGPGTRRGLRAELSEWSLHHDPEEQVVELRFRLPKGTYATVLLRELLKTDEVRD